MKIWELKLENGLKYKDNFGCVWIVKDGDLITKREQSQIHCSMITDKYTISELQGMEFEEIKPKVTDWERCELNENYIFLNDEDDIEIEAENNHKYDDKKYEICNYFSTKSKAREVANEQLLYRKMKKFRDENDEYVDWFNTYRQAYYVGFSSEEKILKVTYVTNGRDLHTIYFTTKELAQRCLDEIVKPHFENKGAI